MPIQMAMCRICGQEVTKRSTLSLAILGAAEKDGRACRSHKEVEIMVQTVERSASDARQMAALIASANRVMNVLSGAAAVRVFHTFHGWDPEFTYARLATRFDEKTMALIREEVGRQGGPTMSTEEIGLVAMSALWVSRKKKELGV